MRERVSKWLIRMSSKDEACFPTNFASACLSTFIEYSPMATISETKLKTGEPLPVPPLPSIKKEKDADEATPDQPKGLSGQLACLAEKVSLLELHQSSDEGISPPLQNAIPAQALESECSSADSAYRTKETGSTLYWPFPIVGSREEEVCKKLFAPLDSLPKPSELKERLLANIAAPIPIHLHVYKLLRKIDPDMLKATFCIVENTGNICPSLTPAVENALQMKNVNTGTQAMRQHVLDAFLMCIMKAAQEHLSNIRIDRNAKQKPNSSVNGRPRYLLMFDNVLVFKGEEKKTGDVRKRAKKLREKIVPGFVGEKGLVKYLLGYASAGSRIIFECIQEDRMDECSDILDLTEMEDRVKMLIILINIVRIARIVRVVRSAPAH